MRAYDDSLATPLLFQPMTAHPQQLSIQDFQYHLPAAAVAPYPLANRDQAKLLLYRRGTISDHVFRELPEQLPPGALLVFNDTKVVRARLLFTKPTGGAIELFCLEPVYPHAEMQLAMQQTGECVWKCLVGNAKRWRSGVLQIPLAAGALSAERLEKTADAYLIRFSWQPAHVPFAEVLEQAGQVPLPPYFNRPAEATDQSRYQTVYAATAGAVAAPTAGLHFTPAVLAALAQRQQPMASVTLHVGAGTFKPVKAAAMADHPMHAEELSVSVAFIQQLLEHLPQPVIPVGTTSLRTLESLYWLGVMVSQLPLHAAAARLHVPQWLPYAHSATLPPAAEALELLLHYLTQQECDYLSATTQILIAPGYQFKICTGLLTNFHQPESTLLLLVAALVGNDWRRIYQHALQHQYRFLSYGDSSLLLP